MMASEDVPLARYTGLNRKRQRDPNLKATTSSLKSATTQSPTRCPFRRQRARSSAASMPSRSAAAAMVVNAGGGGVEVGAAWVSATRREADGAD